MRNWDLALVDTPKDALQPASLQGVELQVFQKMFKAFLQTDSTKLSLMVEIFHVAKSPALVICCL